jgi:predicted nucleic acid-binding protein
MCSFKISSDPEVAALIEKHGTNDALFITNLTYFTDIPLTEVGGSSYDAMNTGVRKIIPGLSSERGLTRSEYTVLGFWSDHSGVVKVPFLINHAHTIISARAHRNQMTEYDMKFIRYTASCIEEDVINSDRMLSEYTDKGDGPILDLAYQSRVMEGIARMKARCLEYEGGRSAESLCADLIRPCIENPRLRESNIEMHQAETTLPELKRAISCAENDKLFLTECVRICDERIQMLNEKREGLKKQ